MANDEVIRLELQLKGQEGVQATTKSLDTLAAKTQDAASTYEVLASAENTAYAASRKLQDETDRAVAAAVRQTQANKGVAQSTESVDKATKNFVTTTKASGDSAEKSGRAFLDSGRFLQDFAQGGVGGVLNNLEGIGRSFRDFPLSAKDFTAAIMSPAGVAGALTLVGTTAYVAYPFVRDFVKAIVDGANELPAAADSVGKMTTALDANKKALDELKGKQSLTNSELERYNGLLANQAGLERDVAKAKKEKADADKLTDLKPFGQAEKDRDRAANLQAELADPSAGPGSPAKKDILIGEVAKVYEAEAKRQIQAQIDREGASIRDRQASPNPFTGQGSDLDPEIIAARGRIRDLMQRLTNASTDPSHGERAAGLVGGAVIGGDPKKLQEILDLIGGKSKFRTAVESHLPESVNTFLGTVGDKSKILRLLEGQLPESVEADEDAERAEAKAEEVRKEKKVERQKKRDAKDESLAYQVQFDNARKDAAKKATAKAKADKTKADRKTKADAATAARKTKKRRDDIYTDVSVGSIDEDASEFYARRRLTPDEQGRTVSPGRAAAALRQQVGQRLAVERPDLSQADHAATADRITTEASGQVETMAESGKRAILQGARQAGQIVDVGQAMAASFQEVYQTVAALATRAERTVGSLNGTAAQFRNLRNNMTTYSESRLP